MLHPLDSLITCEAIFSSPLAWIADELERRDLAPPRRAVVLIAAERQAHVIRRLLCVERARPDAIAGVLFLRPVELARELLVHAGTVRLPGLEEVRRLRILQLFESDALARQLRYFTPAQLRSGHGYVDAFARTIADLEASGLTATLALSLAERLSPKDRLAADRLYDVARTWEAAESRASGTPAVRATTPQVLAEATALITARPDLLAPWGPVFAVLTASPSTVLLRFLRALPNCRTVFQEARPWRADVQRWRPLLGLEPERISQQSAAADTDVGTSELRLAQRFLFEVPEILTDPNRPRSRGADGSVDLEEYASIEDEIEAATTWVTEQVAAGIAVADIALIVPEIDPYAGLLADRLTRLASGAALRSYIAGGLSWTATPAGMRSGGLLHALQRGLEAEATIRVLPWLRRGQQGNDAGRERLSPSRAAEIVYGAGIVGGSPGDRTGVGEWTARLTRRRDALRQRIESLDDNATAATTTSNEPQKRLDVRTQHNDERWLRDVEPILPAIAALQELAELVLGGASLAVFWPQLRAFCERWLRIPPEPPNLLALLAQAIAPVLTDPVADAVSGNAALRIIADVLRRERHTPTRFGEPAVFIGTCVHAAGLPFAAVRVLGLAEGALPHTPHDDPIVPDELRKHIEDEARLMHADITLPRLADHVLDDIHGFFRVVSNTGVRLALSAPRQWIDRSEREVSGILLEAATALGRSPSGTEEGDVPTAARLRASYLNPGREARVHAASVAPLSPRALSSLTPAATVDTLIVPAGWAHDAALAVDRLSQIAGGLDRQTLTEIDGMVSDAWAMMRPLGLTPQRPISATAVITLLGCPHRFLLERILYLSAPTARPSTDVIAPIIYGTLFHAAAERFFREAGPALCRRDGELSEWVDRARAIAAEEFEALRHEYPMRGEDGIARERDRLLRQIEQLVHYEWQLPPREFLASEWVFGDPQPVRLAVDGGDLYVRGAIDRVDRIGSTALSVRDLKTGRVRDFGENPINAARDLQIGLYVLALEATGFGGAPVGGAAYVHPSAAQEPDRAFDAGNIDLLRRHTRAWLGIARKLLADGMFPRTPNVEDCMFCPFVPACGEGAQQRSAAKLDKLPLDHPLTAFVVFKRKKSEEEA